jgi:hypothetical protein
VYDTVYAGHVNTTGSNICCNECHAFPVLETLHGSVSASLCQPTVKRLNGHPIVGQVIAHSVNASASAAEHDGSSTLADQFSSDVWFLGVGHQPKMMSHAFHADFLWSDFDRDRVDLVITNKVSNFIIECGTKQDGLSVLFTCVKDLANGFHETHVRHSVCFIKHNH